MTKLFFVLTLVAASFSANTFAKDRACPQFAKLCSDGSSVSPAGPKCEVPDCPNTRHILQCGDQFLLKAEPTGTKMKQYYFVGVDIANARVWIERKGKKFKTEVERNEEDASFSTMYKGKPLVIKAIGQQIYGAFYGDSKTPWTCNRVKEAPPAVGGDREGEKGEETSSD